MTPTQKLREALARKGLPLTQQRLAVFEALEKAKDHPSAEALHRALRGKYPSLSLATVYKTLQTLKDVGLAQVVNAPHAEARFDAITGVHHHAICRGCGRIEDVFDARLDRLSAPRVKGFELGAHSVHFYGLCGRCKTKKL
ncbi:MAG: transcriptional repressor [Elusimicrobia bacterium]|nr:transcriptional repressor [Elusimicrobiota bacterium]